MRALSLHVSSFRLDSATSGPTRSWNVPECFSWQLEHHLGGPCCYGWQHSACPLPGRPRARISCQGHNAASLRELHLSSIVPSARYAEPPFERRALGAATSSVDADKLFEEVRVAAGASLTPPVLRLSSSTAERGLVLQDGTCVAAGELLLRVPMSAVIAVPSTVSRSIAHERGWIATGVVGESDSRLAVELLKEVQREGSVWEKYKALLPAEVECVCQWASEELQELQDLDACEQVHIRCRRDQEKAMWIAAALDSALGGGLRSALWALHMVHTRSFTAMGGDTKVQCMVPLVDMMNHAYPEQPVSARRARPASSQSRNLSGSLHSPSPVWPRSHASADLGFAPWRIRQAADGTEFFEVFSTTALSEGQEATFPYGPFTNQELLFNYGFVPATNPADKLLLYPNLQDMMDDVEERVRMLKPKSMLLQAMHGTDMPFWLMAGGVATKLLESLFVLHARDAEELTGLEAEWWRSKSLASARVDPSTRAVAAKQLINRCRDLLYDSPTSAQEDQVILQGDVSHRRRLAVLLRLSAKSLLLKAQARYSRLADMGKCQE